MVLICSYPANWTDYSELFLHTDQFLENALHLAEFSWKAQVARLDKPVSKDYWAMSADTVNAYYDPSLNSINFPAGLYPISFCRCSCCCCAKLPACRRACANGLDIHLVV